MFKIQIVELQISDLKSTQSINKRKKNKLKDSIEKNGFDYNKGYIFVSKDNEIINGNHRYTALLELKGGRYKIKVKKTILSKRIYVTKIIGLTLIFMYLIHFLFT